ncbi:MAG: hypothetical protein V2J89_14145 [Halieaceae bacterium]|nr:hypothetical protein [Halieaceae bacterium]
MSEEQTITIDGKEYKAADLSDEVKSNLVGMRSAEQEVARLQSLIAIAQTARNAYANAVRQGLGIEES